MRELALKRRYKMLPAAGHCHNCGEALARGRLFCDADCRDDWEHRQARAQIGCRE